MLTRLNDVRNVENFISPDNYCNKNDSYDRNFE